MFTVLKVIRDRPRGAARLLWRVRPPQPELIRVAVKGGAPYFVLRVYTMGDTPPWAEILHTVGRCASRILTDAEITLPEGGNVRRFVPQYLPLLAAMHTLADTLALAQSAPRRWVIGVYDPSGALCGQLHFLLRYAADVRVCTQKTAAYDAESRRLSALCGAGLTVGETSETLRGCNLLLCENADALPLTTRTVACRGKARENVLLCTDPHIPSPYREQTPEHIDPMTFAAALYELCGVRALAGCRFASLRYGAQTLSLADAAQRLDG